MHYYSFNIGDYRKDTVHLKPIEHYIYRTLIDMYYLNEKPIPKKTQWVMRRLNLETEEEKKALENVLMDFFYESEDGFRHDRIDEEIEKYQANAEKNRKNGKKGGRPPKNKPKKTQSVSDGLPDESEQNPNQEPLTTNHEPSTINQLINYWNEKRPANASVNADVWGNKIKARLKKFSVEEIQNAMDYILTSKWHIENNQVSIKHAINSDEKCDTAKTQYLAKKNKQEKTNEQSADKYDKFEKHIESIGQPTEPTIRTVYPDATSNETGCYENGAPYLQTVGSDVW